MAECPRALDAVAMARRMYTKKSCGSFTLVNTGKAMSIPKFISAPLFSFVAACRRGDRVEGNRYSAILVGAHLRSNMHWQAIVLSPSYRALLEIIGDTALWAFCSYDCNVYRRVCYNKSV